MILFILYIAQNDSSVSMSPGYVGLSRHVLGLSGISLLLRVVSHQRAHDGITWNVNNDDGEAPRLLSLEFFKFLIFEKNVILIAYPYYSCNYKTKEGSNNRVFYFFPKSWELGHTGGHLGKNTIFVISSKVMVQIHVVIHQKLRLNKRNTNKLSK